MDQRFQKLREMEAFTDALFDRIFSFQEKKHAAWDATAPFDARIQSIALHNLIFSNPDRDPETSGPTIAHFYPLREENRAMAYYAKQTAETPTVLDVHGRNGFVGSLLAREGLKVIGLRNPEDKPNQIPDFFDEEVYEMREGTLADIDQEIDVAFCAWMPSGVNVTPEIVALNPKMIIYVYTEHVNEYSKKRQTGTPEAFDDLPHNYRIVDEWEILRPENLLQEVWPDLSPSLEEKRIVRIYADESVAEIPQYGVEEMAVPYDWEADLEMALLALEAKSNLRARGIVV